MPNSFIPPEDPPTSATPHSTMMYKAPTSATIAATKPAPLPQVKPSAPSPLQGVMPQKSSIIEPPSITKLAAAPSIQPQPLPESGSPDQVMTTPHESSTNFNLFISIFTGIVVLIWIGVGLLYYSNTQLEQEVTQVAAPTTI